MHGPAGTTAAVKPYVIRCQPIIRSSADSREMDTACFAYRVARPGRLRFGGIPRIAATASRNGRAASPACPTTEPTAPALDSVRLEYPVTHAHGTAAHPVGLGHRGCGGRRVKPVRVGRPKLILPGLQHLDACLNGRSVLMVARSLERGESALEVLAASLRREDAPLEVAPLDLSRRGHGFALGVNNGSRFGT